MVKAYDCGIHYHPRKANVVADTLSMDVEAVLSMMRALSHQLTDEINNLGVEVTRGLDNMTLQ